MGLDTSKLAALIDSINNIATVSDHSSAAPGGNEEDLAGRVYEYFLGKFAATEGKGGGEFYTPSPNSSPANCESPKASSKSPRCSDSLWNSQREGRGAPEKQENSKGIPAVRAELAGYR